MFYVRFLYIVYEDESLYVYMYVYICGSCEACEAYTTTVETIVYEAYTTTVNISLHYPVCYLVAIAIAILLTRWSRYIP